MQPSPKRFKSSGVMTSPSASSVTSAPITAVASPSPFAVTSPSPSALTSTSTVGVTSGPTFGVTSASLFSVTSGPTFGVTSASAASVTTASAFGVTSTATSTMTFVSTMTSQSISALTSTPTVDSVCPLSVLLNWTRQKLREAGGTDIQMPPAPYFPLTLLTGTDDTQRRAYGLRALRRLGRRVNTSSCGLITLKPLIIGSLQDLVKVKQCCRRCIILLEGLFPSFPDHEDFNQCLHVFSSLRSLTDRENLVIVSISTALLELVCERGHYDIFSTMQKWTLTPNVPPSVSSEPGEQTFPYASESEGREMREYFRLQGILTPAEQKLSDLSLLENVKRRFYKVDDFLRTPARYACMKGHLTLVRNMLCCTSDDKEFGELLCQFWKKLDKERDLESILDKAIETVQDPRVIRGLLQHGASPTYRTRSGSNLLQVLFSHHLRTFSFLQLFPLLKYLTCSGSDTLTSRGENLLHLACANNSLQFVDLLARECPVLIFGEDDKDRTPLMQAVEKDQPSLAEVMLEHAQEFYNRMEKPPDLQDYLNHLFLNASAIGSVKQVDFYLSHGADWKATSEAKMNALQIACEMGHTQVVERLLPTMAPLMNCSEIRDCKPLMMATNHPFPQTSLPLIQVLLNHGASVNEEDGGSPSALHQACLSGNEQVATLLIEHGANVNAQDELGRTPLHNSAEEGHTNLVQLLVDHGAKLTPVDIQGHTPEAVASLYCQWRVLALFRHINMQQGTEFISMGADMARSF